MLGSEEQWSLNRSLNYYAILQLQMFCKRAGKREKITCVKGFPGGSAAKNLPAVQEPQEMGSIPGLGRSPGGGRATRSSILACRIPWTEEPGGLQARGSQRVGHSRSELARMHHM